MNRRNFIVGSVITPIAVANASREVDQVVAQEADVGQPAYDSSLWGEPCCYIDDGGEVFVVRRDAIVYRQIKSGAWEEIQ